jgi:hypothetical protein
MTNGDIKSALDALTELCGPTNRLPVLDSIEATRSYTAFNDAWAPSEAERLKLVEEHGTKGKEGVSVKGKALGPFLQAWSVVMSGECDTPTFKAIPIASIEQGHAKDTETGKKIPLDVSPAALMVLMELGLIDDGQNK